MIGIDQYVAVVNPLHYHRNVNEFRCKLMCLSAWIVSICLVILTSIDQSIEYQFVANLVTLTLAYVIPIGAILVIYFRIFIAARSNSIKTRQNSSCSIIRIFTNTLSLKREFWAVWYVIFYLIVNIHFVIRNCKGVSDLEICMD